MTTYSPPAHRMTDQELRAALTFDDRWSECDRGCRNADQHAAHDGAPTVSPWVRNAIAGTLPAPTLAPTRAEIDCELFERYRFAFCVRP